MAIAGPDTAGAPARSPFAGLGGPALRARTSDAWRWWTRALATWLPPRLRTLFGLARERLVLQPSGAGLRIAVAGSDGLRPLAEVPLPAQDIDDPLAPLLAGRMRRLRRWLLLPADAALRRTLPLPAAAGDRLREVLGFEIERQTPFPASAVEYDARLAGRLPDGRIEAELMVVPRAVLEARLAALGPLAGTLAGVDLEGADGEPLGVNLLPGTRRHRHVDPWRPWNLVLASVALAATVAGFWQVLDNRRAAADALEAEVAASAERARAAATQRQVLVDLVEGMAFLQGTRAARPTMVEVMDELARRLPDSTWLEKLSIEDTRILLIGLSSEAPALVQQLEGSALWRSPALTGALQPDPRTGRDRFTLTAELVVGPVPAPPGATVQPVPGEGDARARSRP